MSTILVNYSKNNRMIYLRRDLFVSDCGKYSKGLTPSELFVLTSISWSLNSGRTQMTTSAECLLAELWGSHYQDNRSLRKTMVDGLKSLRERKTIRINKDKFDYRSIITIDCKNVAILNKENFIGLDIREVREILDFNGGKTKKENLLSVLIWFIKPISIHETNEFDVNGTYGNYEFGKDHEKWKGVYGFQSLEKMEEYTGLSEKSIIKYRDVLCEDLGLLFCWKFENYNKTNTDDGVIVKRMANAVGRNCHAPTIIKVCQSIENQLEYNNDLIDEDIAFDNDFSDEF